jgi:hypothetical protein
MFSPDAPPPPPVFLWLFNHTVGILYFIMLNSGMIGEGRMEGISKET